MKKTLMITGACGSIGSILSRHFDAQGHQLILLDLDQMTLAALGKKLHPNHLLITFDLWTSGYDQYSQLATELTARVSKIDALIHCAGLCGNLQPLQHTTPMQWLKALQVNLTSPFWLTQTLTPLLQKGRVIFTTHDQLRETQDAYWHGFGVAQSGLDTLINELNNESQTLGFSVHRVNPPWLENNFSRQIFPDGQPHWQQPESVIPLYEDVLQ